MKIVIGIGQLIAMLVIFAVLAVGTVAIYKAFFGKEWQFCEGNNPRNCTFTPDFKKYPEDAIPMGSIKCDSSGNILISNIDFSGYPDPWNLIHKLTGDCANAARK